MAGLIRGYSLSSLSAHVLSDTGEFQGAISLPRVCWTPACAGVTETRLPIETWRGTLASFSPGVLDSAQVLRAVEVLLEYPE